MEAIANQGVRKPYSNCGAAAVGTSNLKTGSSNPGRARETMQRPFGQALAGCATLTIGLSRSDNHSAGTIANDVWLIGIVGARRRTAVFAVAHNSPHDFRTKGRRASALTG
jgi:hypothetical protein